MLELSTGAIAELTSAVWACLRLKERAAVFGIVSVITRRGLGTVEVDRGGADAGGHSTARDTRGLIVRVSDAQASAVDEMEAFISLSVFGESDFVVRQVVVGGDFADVASEVGQPRSGPGFLVEFVDDG